MDVDKPVKLTSNDALSSRKSAVYKGYLKDDFIDYFHTEQIEIKPPMINRGTFIRSFTVDNILLEFAKNNIQEKVQIISLGAGLDTRYFYTKEQLKNMRLNYHYFEIDFPEIACMKINKIMNIQKLNQSLEGEISTNENEDSLNSSDYTIVAGDLREFKDIVYTKLLNYGLDTKLPTLLIAECVLVYIEPGLVDNMIEFITQSFNQVALLSYEPTLKNKHFSDMMISNLKRRGIHLKGLDKYGNIKQQEQRYLKLGFSDVISTTVWDIEKQILNSDIIKRLNNIERLDEVEEWNLLAEHYGFIYSCKNISNVSFSNLKNIK